MSRAHHPTPEDHDLCMICKADGLYYHDGTYLVCMAPHTEGRRQQLQRDADAANANQEKLARIGRVSC